MDTRSAAVAASNPPAAGIGGNPELDEELFAGVVAASRQGIAIIDPESRAVVFANRRLAILAGCSAGQLSGRSLESYVLDDPEAIAPLHEALDSGKPVRTQLRGQDSAGYNEHVGAAAGDECLKRVAGSIEAKLRRAGEFVARYDESRFVAVVGGNAKQTEPLAEAIRTAVCNLELAHPASMTSSVVTVSVGVASEQPGCDDRPADLVAHARSALSDARDNGRNNVAFATTK